MGDIAKTLSQYNVSYQLVSVIIDFFKQRAEEKNRFKFNHCVLNLPSLSQTTNYLSFY